MLSFLLAHNLLDNRFLVIFADGAREIKTLADQIFGFCPHDVILDWFHLRKHCYELLSMTLVSGKENREKQYEVRRRLYHLLWGGCVDAAIAYIQNLPTEYIKNEKRRSELIGYLNNKRAMICCYAIRRRLGLRISSNPVEKANDLTVARRQKGKGMSWSSDGSGALAAISAMYLNCENEGWHRNKIIKREMYPKIELFYTRFLIDLTAFSTFS